MGNEIYCKYLQRLAFKNKFIQGRLANLAFSNAVLKISICTLNYITYQKQESLKKLPSRDIRLQWGWGHPWSSPLDVSGPTSLLYSWHGGRIARNNWRTNIHQINESEWREVNGVLNDEVKWWSEWCSEWWSVVNGVVNDEWSEWWSEWWSEYYRIRHSRAG